MKTSYSLIVFIVVTFLMTVGKLTLTSGRVFYEAYILKL